MTGFKKVIIYILKALCMFMIPYISVTIVGYFPEHSFMIIFMSGFIEGAIVVFNVNLDRGEGDSNEKSI